MRIDDGDRRIVPGKERRRRLTPKQRAQMVEERRVRRIDREQAWKDTREAKVEERLYKRSLKDPQNYSRPKPFPLEQRRGDFIMKWAATFGTREVQVRHLKAHAGWFEELVGDEDLWMPDEWRPVSAGRLLFGLSGKLFGTYMLLRRKETNGAYRWQLINVAPSQFEEVV